MQARWIAGVFVVGLAVVGTMTASGCIFVYYEDDCERARDCPTGATGTGGMSSSSSGSGTSTGTGGMPPGCEGDPTTDGTLVREECGVFAQADAAGTTEDGTQSHP
jgi:hypothetical protein